MPLQKIMKATCLFALLLIAQLSFAQNRVITGKITDSKDGTGLQGVTVTAKGSRSGTQTGTDGSFSLSVANSVKTIVVSSVGFATQEINVEGKTSVTVSLLATNLSLNEVVVIGYGTQRKRDVIGSIARVKGDQITSIAAPSFEAALQGKAPGVQVIQGSGLAGSSSVIRIRGVGSISAGGDPLYVIDGIPIIQDNFLRTNSGAQNQNPLAAINPNDIESIEILKDAGATGIYGSRGANGVILVTTKRGKAGKPSFNYNNKIGISTWAKRPDFLNGQEWLQLRQEAWQNDGNAGAVPLPGGVKWADAVNTNTDWWDQITSSGFINEHSLSYNGGGKKIRTYIGAVYSDNQSYINNNAYTRYGIRANLDYKVNEKLTVLLNSAYNRGINKRVPAAWAGGLGDVMSSALPIYPVYNPDNTYFTGGANPVRRQNETKWRNYDDRILGGLTLQYSPIKDLILKVQGSLDYLNSVDHQFETQNWLNRTDIPGIAKSNPIWGTNWTTTATAQYNWNLNAKNRFLFLAGYEMQENHIKGYNGEIYANTDKPFYDQMELYRDSVKWFKTRPASRPGFDEVDKDRWTFNSIFARINYTLNNKYAFQFQARYDGSSKFGSNYKHGFFPSGSAAWTISEEDFMKNQKLINFLKFRISYGIVGNANIPSGEYYANYRPGAEPYLGQNTVYWNSPGNANLRWEELQNFDAAIEFAILNSKVTGELAYYNKQSTDFLVNSGIQPNTGFTTNWRNLDGGKILNEGIELSLNAKLIDKADLKISVGGNVARNYNELKSLGVLDADAVGGGTNDTRVVVGYPVGTNYVVRFHGVDPADGLPVWYDKEGKLTKTFSLNNRVPVGSVIPDYVGAFNTNVNYKGLELTTLFTYTIGGNIYDGSAKRQVGVVTDWNMRRDILNRWQKPGDIAQFPRLTMNPGTYDGLSSEWQYNSTMFLYDASYLRLRELTLAYNIPFKKLEKMKLRNARIFVTGMNLLTFTKYPGGDPEIARDFENAADRNLSPNVTYLTPPQQKSVVFGINVTF